MQPGQVWGLTLLPSQGRIWSYQESSTLKTGAFPFPDLLLIASSAERKTIHGLLYNPLTYQFPLVSFPYLSYSESKIERLSHSHNDRKKPYDPLSMGCSRQEYWSGLPCPSLGGLSDPEIEPKSLLSPALAGGLFTTSATWEALSVVYLEFKIYPCCLQRQKMVKLNILSRFTTASQ